MFRAASVMALRDVGSDGVRQSLHLGAADLDSAFEVVELARVLENGLVAALANVGDDLPDAPFDAGVAPRCAIDESRDRVLVGAVDDADTAVLFITGRSCSAGIRRCPARWRP